MSLNASTQPSVCLLPVSWMLRWRLLCGDSGLIAFAFSPSQLSELPPPLISSSPFNLLSHPFPSSYVHEDEWPLTRGWGKKLPDFISPLKLPPHHHSARPQRTHHNTRCRYQTPILNRCYGSNFSHHRH